MIPETTAAPEEPMPRPNEVGAIGRDLAGALAVNLDVNLATRDCLDLKFVIERQSHAERVEARAKVCRGGWNLDADATPN